MSTGRASPGDVGTSALHVVVRALVALENVPARCGGPSGDWLGERDRTGCRLIRRFTGTGPLTG